MPVKHHRTEPAVFGDASCKAEIFHRVLRSECFCRTLPANPGLAEFYKIPGLACGCWGNASPVPKPIIAGKYGQTKETNKVLKQLEERMAGNTLKLSRAIGFKLTVDDRKLNLKIRQLIIEGERGTKYVPEVSLENDGEWVSFIASLILKNVKLASLDQGGKAMLRHVKELTLDQCDVADLDGLLQACPMLKRLTLKRMRLTELPASIAFMELDYLNADHNGLTVVPAMLDRIPTLRYLSLKHNLIVRYEARLAQIINHPTGGIVNLADNLLAHGPPYVMPLSCPPASRCLIIRCQDNQRKTCDSVRHSIDGLGHMAGFINLSDNLVRPPRPLHYRHGSPSGMPASSSVYYPWNSHPSML